MTSTFGNCPNPVVCGESTNRSDTICEPSGKVCYGAFHRICNKGIKYVKTRNFCHFPTSWKESRGTNTAG